MRKFTFLALALFIFNLHSVLAQSTFSTIHGIMQTNCAASGCHDGSNAQVFDVTGSETDVYNALVNIIPANAAAAAKGNKLVDPGHPYNSFLLRKIGSNGFDAYIQVDDAEKSGHPVVGLQNYEIELIRQWIMDGASETGTIAVSYQTLQDYYTQGGLDFIPVPTAPAPDKGMQVRMGPIFLAPGAEFEYMKKENLHNTNLLKVGQTNGYMAWQSHHMLLFKHVDDGSSEPDGLRRVPFESAPFNGNITLTGAWQNDGDFVMPEGTAFYWAPNTILDFDYHIKNYSQTEILPADFYLNIMYSEEENPVEMHAELVNNAALVLFQGENVRTASHIPGGNETHHIYMLSSHTHKYGTDYDIYIRNPDGSKGEQIYEGFYNEDYTFNQGFYDWDHPAIRYFQDLKEFNAADGLIYEVKWDVAQPIVTFGLTTNDEMMLFTYLYTKEDISTGIRNVEAANEALTVYPNPFTGATEIKYSLEKNANVQVEIFDMVGKRVASLLNREMSTGNHSLTVTEDMLENKAGLYVVTLTVDGRKMSTARITKL